MVIHDLNCLKCNRVIRNHVFPSAASLDDPRQMTCECGGRFEIQYNVSYGRQFSGGWNGLKKDQITVYEGPNGEVSYPGRADVPMPERLAKRGFVRRELQPCEVSSFEKKNGVVCESLHWNSGGMNAPVEDKIPSLDEQIKYSDLTN